MLAIFPAYAVEIDVNFRGKLIIPPPCEFNDGVKKDINFLDVGINKVNGINYQQTIDYVITCEDKSPQWAMTLTLSGDKAVFLDGTIQTDVDGLGIQITIDGKPMMLGEDFPINPAALPELKAVPVKKSGTELQEGKFNATATLLAQYQ